MDRMGAPRSTVRDAYQRPACLDTLMRTTFAAPTRRAMSSIQCTRPTRGSFNRFGSPSTRPNEPVVYANLGMLRRLLLNLGQPMRFPLRLPVFEAKWFFNAADNDSNALLYASLLYSAHQGAISFFHSFHQRRCAYIDQSAFPLRASWDWMCASMRL